MNERLDELETVDVVRGATVLGVEYRQRSDVDPVDGDTGGLGSFATKAPSSESSCVAVAVEGIDEVLSRLVVGADGPKSVVKAAGGFSAVGWRYDQSALVATVDVATGDEGNSVAWQRFLPSGPVALLPLSDTVSSLVWSTSPERAKELVGLPSAEFIAELNFALNGTIERDEEEAASGLGNGWAPLGAAVQDAAAAVGDKAAAALRTARERAKEGLGSSGERRDPPLVIGVADSSRASFPLSLSHCNEYVRPRLALAGDAAHKVHPLAGQGLNLGLGDAEELAATVARAYRAGLDPGDINGLVEYERQRQRAVVPVMAATDFFKRIFSTSHPTVSWLRGIGVLAVDRAGPIKGAIMRIAMGA